MRTKMAGFIERNRPFCHTAHPSTAPARCAGSRLAIATPMPALLLLLAAESLSVLLLRDARAQAIAMCAFGLLLAIVFFAAGAPTAAVCELALGGVALPVLILALREGAA